MSKKQHSHMPKKNRPIWVMFDLDNGDKKSRRYLWWFETKKAAIEHRKWQMFLTYGASLSEPEKYIKA